MKPHHHKKRQVSDKHSLHLVLKARGNSFASPRAKQIVDRHLLKYGKYFGVKIYHRAIVANHIHLILMPGSQESLAGFLRVVSGQIAARLKALNGVKDRGYRDRFWISRPWSRVLSWGRD